MNRSREDDAPSSSRGRLDQGADADAEWFRRAETTRRGFLTGLSLGSLGLLAACTTSSSPERLLPATGPRSKARTVYGLNSPTPWSLTAASTLSEDFLLATPQVTSASNPQDDQVSAFAMKDGSTQAIVKIGTTLYYLHPDATQPGGWTMTQLPPIGVLDVVTVTTLDAKTNPQMYYRDGTGVRVMQLDVDNVRWGDINTPLAWNAPLQVSNVWGFNPITFSYDRAGGKINWREPKDAGGNEYEDWSGTLTNMPFQAVGDVSVALTGTNANLSVFACDPQGQVHLFLTAAAIWDASGTQSLTPALVAGLPGGRKAVGVHASMSVAGMFAVVEDDQGSLWTLASTDPVSSSAPVATIIWDANSVPVENGPPLGPVQRVTTIQLDTNNADEDALLHVYVIGRNGLYVIRQVDLGIQYNTVTPQYAPALPLQPDVVSASVPQPHWNGVPTGVVAVDSAGAVEVLTQPAGGGRWSSQQVLIPTPEPQRVNTYRLQLSLNDSNGQAVPNSQLSLTSDTPQVALVKGQAVTIGTNQATVTTDTTGRATVAVVANGVYTPPITASASWLSPQLVYPSGEVHAYLTGTTTLHTLPTLSASTLAAAKVTDPDTGATKVLASNLQDPSGKTNTDLATVAADAITGAAVHGTPTAGLPYSGLTKAGVAAAKVRTKPSHGGRLPQPLSRPPRVGGISLSLQEFFDDVVHAIKTAAAAVHTVTSSIQTLEDGTKAWVMNVAGDFAAWGISQIDIIVKTVEDAAHAVHAAFNWIKAELDDVISFLRAGVTELLKATSRLAAAMETKMQQLPAFLDAELTALDADVTGWFTAQETALRKNIDSLNSKLGSTTMADAAKPPQVSKGQLRGSASVDPSTFSSGSHQNWLFDKLSEFFSGSSLFPSDDGLTDLLSTLETDIATQVEAFADDTKTAWSKLFGQLTTIDGARKLSLATIVTTIIETLLDGALHLAEAAVKSLIAVVKQVVDTFANWIKTATISLADIPLVGPLLKIAGVDASMSLTHLVALLIAFPTTFIYKIENGEDAELAPVGQGRLGAKADPEITFLAVGCMSLWSFFDYVGTMYLALNPVGTKLPILNAIDTLMPMFVQLFTKPGLTWEGDALAPVPDDTVPEKFTKWAYLAGFVPLILNLANGFTPAKAEGAQTFEETAFPIVAAVGAFFSTIWGCGAADADPDVGVEAYFGAVLGNLPVVGGLCMLTPVREATSDFSAIFESFNCLLSGSAAAIIYAFDN